MWNMYTGRERFVSSNANYSMTIFSPPMNYLDKLRKGKAIELNSL